MPRRTRSQLRGGGRSGDRERPMVPGPKPPRRDPDARRFQARRNDNPPPALIIYAVDEAPPWRADGKVTS